MSWAEEDWTVGLSGQVLQKVKELQVQHQRLSRETKQKQLQLDNIQTNLEKQTLKYDEVRADLHSVHRELQKVREEAKTAVINSECLTQELQTKQAQVCSFEGQLDAARTLNNKLTQEVKRLEAELEKLQNSSRLGDTTLFSTPCWNTSSPWEHSGSRKEEEKLGRRDEAQSKHSRQQLQFSDFPTTSLPRQQNRSTPHRHPSDQSESFSTPLAVFPWERDDTRPTNRRQSPTSPQTPCSDVISQGQLAVGLCGMEKDHRTEEDLSEIKSRISFLEEELSVKARTLKSIENDLVQSKKVVTAREISLQKARDELTLAHTRITQENERASVTEQRLKQLQEELRCQRQNAESSRLQHQQRTKEMEKQHQRDMLEAQKERQFLEKQHQQELNKLNQELHQARTLHNILQAQNDKMSLQKQVLDKELETLKEKLKWTEGQLLESQRKETQTQAKLADALREAEGVAVTLEQSRKRERSLEEEGRRLVEERTDALRLLRDLQEQKAAPAPPPQTVQFCPVGQSFSPQPSYALHSRMRRTAGNIRAKQREEEEEEESMDEKTPEMTASYPSDREPGEGIDSEHISAVISSESESLHREALGRKSKGEESTRRNKEGECDSSGTQKYSGFDPPLSMPTNTSMNVSEKPEHTEASEDLQRQNTMLRSEINDVHEELRKRLEDLEAQRRAEAEARTRLKQLSRKHSSLAADKEEQEKEWRTQLENERAETERLRKAVAALETEVKSRKEESKKNDREEQEKENNAVQNRESEMIELNMQLKKQLAEVKAQLALEQEERMREEERRNQITDMVTDEKKELCIKLAELKAELEEIKLCREKEEKGGEENLLITNSPLKYLTLHGDELNSNIVRCDNKLLPSPEQHHLFCQSTNQLNMLVSQAALTPEGRTAMEPEHLPLSEERQISQTDSASGDSLAESLPSDQTGELSPLHKCGATSPDLEEEVNRLNKEKAQETQRAQQSQVKLEALQNQVTRQTQQLTMAFEKQSQHISGLLAELQEKEGALLSQGEELQRCKQELQALKAEKEVTKISNDDQREESRDETWMETTTTGSLADGDSATQRGKDQTNTDAETPTAVCREGDSELSEQRPRSVDSDKTDSCVDSACAMEETESGQDRGREDVVSELFALRQENQQLKQRIKGLTMSETSNLDIQTDRENQEDQSRQSHDTGEAALPCVMEQRPPTITDASTYEGQGSLLQNNNNKIIREEEEQEEESCQEISLLQEQVVALQMKIRALSVQTQQQTEELTLWRLASHPAPTFDQILPDKDNQEQNSADEMTHIPPRTKSPAPTAQVQEGGSNVTVIREDEVFLSCSSNKPPGRMLFSSLQHINLPEPKSVLQSKQTAALQEYNQDPDKESEKENIEQWSDMCPSQQKDKRDTEAKTGQQAPKGPNKTKTLECPAENPAAKPNASTTANEINAARTDMKSVSSQTEDSWYPRSAPSQLLCAYTKTEEEEDDEFVESPPLSPIPSSKEAKLGDSMLFSGSFPIPADPARLAERIRRNRTQLSAAFDDTEYEPYGLPEVVMKGFADIPSGPSCPYIVRRGLLGTSVVPVQQKGLGQEEEETD